ncbi:MAG: ornithine carbamoyltransferase [Acidobacteria bacterium]|nr:ornithine carbamoyltransferase [Acidobacteriota bacterium]
MKNKDFITIRDWPADAMNELLALADAVKKNPSKYANILQRKALAMIFEKPSLRTRVSFEVGIQQLGGFSLYLTQNEIHLGRRESVGDVARNLERMVDGIMARTFSHAVVEDIARFASIPVINGLTDFCHPCQALADYMTIREAKGAAHGIKIAYIGDGNNVAHSLIYGAARFGAELHVASPAGYGPDPAVVGWAQENGGETGARIEVLTDPFRAAEDADVIYTDVWTSMGAESEAARRREAFRSFQVNDGLVSRARPDYVFMHCLPAHRGEEVTGSVIDSGRSIVFQQAENRLHVQKAVMITLMG